MADVDICVRYCEKALSGDIARYAKMMAELPNSKRVTIFSNKTASEIGDILLNCKKSIQIKISNDFYGGVGFESVDLSMGSSNNKIGADTFAIRCSNKGPISSRRLEYPYLIEIIF